MANVDTRTTILDNVQAASEDEDRYISPPGTVADVWKLNSIEFVPATSVTADLTDYFTVTYYKDSTSLATFDTTATSLVAGTPKALTITGTMKDLEFTTGTNVLKIGVAQSTSTGAICDGQHKAVWTQIS